VDDDGGGGGHRCTLCHTERAIRVLEAVATALGGGAGSPPPHLSTIWWPCICRVQSVTSSAEYPCILMAAGVFNLVRRVSLAPRMEGFLVTFSVVSWQKKWCACFLALVGKKVKRTKAPHIVPTPQGHEESIPSPLHSRSAGIVLCYQRTQSENRGVINLYLNLCAN
jgi:hypothetical protein